MIRIKTDEIYKLANKIKGLHKEIQKGIKLYIKLLTEDESVGIEPTLKKKINALVYAKENEWYKNTKDLYNATKTTVSDNKIIVYMDDKWLASRPQAKNRPFSLGHEDEYGWATNASGSYAERVENDFTYRNVIIKDYTRKGSHYMEKTYDEIKKNIFSGKADPKVILKPLLKVWSNG